MAITAATAADITATTLEGFQRNAKPEEILQHVQNKPLLRHLMATKKEYGSAGPAASSQSPAILRDPVMGALMKDTASFYAGISDDDQITFTGSDGVVQTSCPVRWMHAGLKINHEELSMQGVHITNGHSVSTTKDEVTNLVNALAVKKADYMESLAFARNRTLWQDGTQDAKAIPGIKSILTDDPTAGTTLGIARTNTWWRHIARTAVGGALAKLVYSKADQTMTETFLSDLRQLGRYGGNPNIMLAGSDFCDAFERECRAKGLLTQTGWADSKTNLQIKGVKVGSLELEYDPTLDDLGESKRCYAWDSRHLWLAPQKKEWGKVTNQNQPYDQFVMLISTTDRGGLRANQLDCHYVADLA